MKCQNSQEQGFFFIVLIQLIKLHEKILYLDSGIFSILKLGVISKEFIAQRVKIS